MLSALWLAGEPGRDEICHQDRQYAKEGGARNEAKESAPRPKMGRADGHEGHRPRRRPAPVEQGRENREAEIVEGRVGDENAAQKKPQAAAGDAKKVQ